MHDRYPPIGDYALLADCHSSALVSRTGCVDWACLRRFDAPSVFGRLLDWDQGGTFALNPEAPQEWSRRYLGDSLVLETVVRTATGSARIIDCFAMHRGGQRQPRDQLLRVVEGIDGEVACDVHIAPRFDYGELRPWLRRAPAGPPGEGAGDTAMGEVGEGGAFTAVGGDSALVISSDVHLDVEQDAINLFGSFRVRPGERRRFSVVAQLPHALDPRPVPAEVIDGRVDETLDWWRRWAVKATVTGPHAEAVRRSAVVLKGLTCAPTGAIVAAPTTSLPEEVGGGRNWDYRYSWIRDSTLALASLSLAGHVEVARGFRDFLLRSTAGTAEDLQIMYGVYGGRHLPEYTVELDGYRGSRPVRVGNGAATQRQLDVYGHILDAAHLWRRSFDEIAPEEWRFLRQLVEEAARVWRNPDCGLWEIRGEPRHFVHSKVMLWVALDRGIRTVEETRLDDIDLDGWRAVRDEIRAAVDAEGVDPQRGCFVQAFGSTELDASLLLLPMVGFVPANDPRMVATVEAIQTDLCVPPHGFVRRYRPERTSDGLPGSEATFLMCSFWMVDVLAMQGRRAEAVELFTALLGVSNDLGLYAEEYDADTGELLGNFPQAFTHMALIDSAHQLACAEASDDVCRNEPWTTAERLAERSW
ncbi:MAG: glycoside hydrolase family 15 protein [Euzebyales bacterium]|nr:glycoside hydrolase family 15 protein [Euzebyales bacterium]